VLKAPSTFIRLEQSLYEKYALGCPLETLGPRLWRRDKGFCEDIHEPLYKRVTMEKVVKKFQKK